MLALGGTETVLQEVGEVAHKILTTQCLDKPNTHDDFRAAQVDSLEAVAICEAFFHPLLELVRVLDHRNSLVCVEGRVVS